MLTAYLFKYLLRKMDWIFVKNPTYFIPAAFVGLMFAKAAVDSSSMELLSMFFRKGELESLNGRWELFLLWLGGYFDPTGWSVSIDTEDDVGEGDETQPTLSKKQRAARERKRELIDRTSKRWLLDSWNSLVSWFHRNGQVLGILTVFYLGIDFLAMYLDFVDDTNLPFKTASGFVDRVFFFDKSPRAEYMAQLLGGIAGVVLLLFIIIGVLVKIPFIIEIFLIIIGVCVCVVVLYAAISLIDSINGNRLGLGSKIKAGVTYAISNVKSELTPSLIEAIVAVIASIAAFYILPSAPPEKKAQLIVKPVYLDKERVVGNSQSLYGLARDPLYWFSLEFELWINPQPSSTGVNYSKDAVIVNLEGRPKATYNNQTGEFKVTCLNSGRKTEVIYSTKSFPLQKWNQIAINYSGGTMEVFVNGELGGSMPGIAPYMTKPLITVGQTNGIAGGIKNVAFKRDTTTPLSARILAL